MAKLKSRNQIFDRLVAGFEGNVLPLKASVIRNMRIKQIHQTLQDEISTMAQPLFDGEEQVYLLTHIVEAAKSVFTMEYKPGDITTRFLRISSQYSLLARYLSLGSFKAMSDQIQNDIVKNSELQLVINQIGGNSAKDLAGKDAKGVVSSMFEALSTTPIEKFNPEFFATNPISESQIAGMVSDTSDRYNNLMTFLGTSRGVPLTAAWRASRIHEFNSVLDAIAWLALLDGPMQYLTYYKGNKKVTPEELEAQMPYLQLDAWTLTIAFSTYMKWAKSADSPWPVIPPPTSPGTASQNLKRHANYLSVVFAQIGTSYISGEIHMALSAFSDTMSIWEPLIATRPSLKDDLKDRFSAIKSRFLSPHEFTISSTEAAMTALRTYFGISHWILPGDEMLQTLRDEVAASMPDSPAVKKFDGLTKIMSRSISQSYPAREQIGAKLDNYLDILEGSVALYSNSNKLHELMLMDNLGIGNQYVLTKADYIQADVVTPLKEVKYASLVSKSPMVSVMPRFMPRKSIEEPSRWILKDDKYQPRYLTLLALSKMDHSHRYVWPSRGRISLGETVTIPYMSLPIPSAYTVELDGEIQPYTIPAFLSLISGHTDGIPSREYLQNFFDIMDSTHGQWDSLLMNAICGAFIVQRKEGSKWVTLYPELPAIYGAPSKLFIDANINGKASGVSWINFDTDEVSYRLMPYSWVPKPQPVINVAYQWTRGCFVNVPVGIYFLSKEYVDGTVELSQVTYDKVRLNVESARLKGGSDPSKYPDLFLRSYGWSNYVSSLPHVLFQVAAPYSSSFEQESDMISAACIKTVFRKEADLGLLTFMAIFDDEVIVIDADDELKAMQFSITDPLKGPEVDGAAPGISGTDSPGSKDANATEIVNAAANSEPVRGEGAGSVAGKGGVETSEEGPLPDSAAGAFRGDAAGAGGKGAAQMPDLEVEDDEKAKGGPLKGQPASKAKVVPDKTKTKTVTLAQVEDLSDPTNEEEANAALATLDKWLEITDLPDDIKDAIAEKRANFVVLLTAFQSNGD